MTDGGFVKTHIPCPDTEGCGSSDGASMNADGSVKCFVCDAFFPDGNGEATEKVEVQRHKPSSIPDTFNTLASRCIRKETSEFYGVTSTTDQTGKDINHYYPYARPDGVVHYKVRDVNTKGFTWPMGTDKSIMLFGQDKFPKNPKKQITLVEGECDAMAAYELLGSQWPVVSVANGASAIKEVKQNLEYLEGFKQIVVAFDNDKAGKEGANKIANLFTPGKVRIMQMPKSAKDPNDALRSKLFSDFNQAWWDAELYTPAGVIDVSTKLDEYLDCESKPSIPYPWPLLNLKLEGFRQGELVTLTGGTGLGKSTVTRELSHWFIRQTQDPIGILALEENWSRTIDGILGITLNKRLHLNSVKRATPREELVQAYANTIDPEKVWVYGHHGVTDIESIFAKLRFMILGCGCKRIILDHLHMLVLADKEQDERVGIDNIMGRLRSLVEETQVGLILVSHLRRVEGNRGHEQGVETGLNHLRGSQSIAQLSDTVISLERNQQAEDEEEASTTRVRVLKCRETGDTGLADSLIYDKETGRLGLGENCMEDE